MAEPTQSSDVSPPNYDDIEKPAGSKKMLIIGGVAFVVLIIIIVLVYIYYDNIMKMFDSTYLTEEEKKKKKKEEEDAAEADRIAKEKENTDRIAADKAAAEAKAALEDAERKKVEAETTRKADDAAKAAEAAKIADEAAKKAAEANQRAETSNVPAGGTAISEVVPTTPAATPAATPIIPTEPNPTISMIEIIGKSETTKLNLAEVEIYDSDGLNIANRAILYINNLDNQYSTVSNIYDSNFDTQILSTGKNLPRITFTFTPARVISYIVISNGLVNPIGVRDATFNMYSTTGVIYKTQLLSDSLKQTIVFNKPANLSQPPVGAITADIIEIAAPAPAILAVAEIYVIDQNGNNIAKNAVITMTDLDKSSAANNYTVNMLTDENNMTFAMTAGNENPVIKLQFRTVVKITSIIIRNRETLQNNTDLCTMTIKDGNTVVRAYTLNSDLVQRYVYGPVTGTATPLPTAPTYGLPAVKKVVFTANSLKPVDISRILIFDDNNVILRNNTGLSVSATPPITDLNNVLPTPSDTATVIGEKHVSIPISRSITFNLSNPRNISKITVIFKGENAATNVGALLEVFDSTGTNVYSKYMTSKDKIQSFIYYAPMPSEFTNARIRVAGTNKYLTYGGDSGYTFTDLNPYDLSGSQTLTKKGKLVFFDTNGRTVIENGQIKLQNPKQKFLRFGSNNPTGFGDRYQGYFILFWDGYTPSDNWISDGYHLYSESFNNRSGQMFRLAATTTDGGNTYRLMCVPPSDTTSRALIVESSSYGPSYQFYRGGRFGKYSGTCPTANDTAGDCVLPRSTALALCESNDDCKGYGMKSGDNEKYLLYGDSVYKADANYNSYQKAAAGVVFNK